FTVSAAPEAVWDFLLDPQRVAPCLPGCESVEIEDATTYRVRLTVKVGFLSTTQNLKVEIVESERPRHLVSLARGEDRKLASQAAFAERGAAQCGFCTPGMMLAAKALLLESPTPTAHEVREALSGNLCRCTGYAKVIEAVLAVASSPR